MNNRKKKLKFCPSWNMTTVVALGGATLFGVATAWSQTGNTMAAPPVAQTNRGEVIGTQEGTISAFLGVPYAAPPVGDLRLRAPQPHAPWTTPVQAIQLAQPCLQNATPGAGVPVVPLGSEDCLYLNIYSPAQAASEHRPVMVFFPGGGFQRSGATFPYYNGQYIAEQSGVIVVTVSYRLAVLGNLAAPALDGESPAGVSGNYGIQDQQAALRWVRDNIGGFGGNPQTVTIFGESAGANSVEYQLTSPLAKGLFGRAIIESAVGLQLMPSLSLAASEAGSSAVAIASLGCAGAADVAGCLRALPANAFLSASGVTEPVVDGYVIPQHPLQAFRSGNFNRVPTIIGTNHDEGTAFVYQTEVALKGPLTPADYDAQLNTMYGDNAPAVLAQYPVNAYSSPIQALAATVTDSSFACPTELKRNALSRYVRVYGYEFSEPNPAQGALLGPPEPGLDYGDYHTSELPYVFGVTAPDGARVTGKDLALSQRIINYWTNLAISSNPNFPRLQFPYWVDDPLAHLLLSFQDDTTYLPQHQFTAAHSCSFWKPLLPESNP